MRNVQHQGVATSEVVTKKSSELRVPILQVSPWILWCMVEMGCTSWYHSDAWCMGCLIMFIFTIYISDSFKVLTHKRQDSQILISKEVWGLCHPFL